MIDWDNPIWIILIFIFSITMFFLLIVGLDYSLHKYPIEVTQNEKIIYEGIKACVSIESAGDTTTIYFSQGLFCMFPKAVLTGRNIEVKTK